MDRFGSGIYTSSTSSKYGPTTSSHAITQSDFGAFDRSDDYSENKLASNLKAVMLNKVVVGKGCKLTNNQPTLTAPPAGYDSVSPFVISLTSASALSTFMQVLAEKGAGLRDDEVIVYTNDAIRPSYLIMYDA